MALFRIFKGNSANLPAEMHDGYCYFTTDDGQFYIDYLEDPNDATSLRRRPISGPGRSIEYIVGTQTASTRYWTGNTKDATLTAGKVIAYKLPYAGTSSASFLELTLANGVTTTGRINVYLNNNTGVTTHFPAGTVILLTYDGSAWKTFDYNSNTNTLVRTFASTTNVELPLIAGSTANSATAAAPTHTSSYKDLYGALPATVANRPTLNPSTGTITAIKFKGPLEGNADTATEFSTNADIALTGDVVGSVSSKKNWSIATTLAVSGVTAGSYGPSANATPGYGTTFDVPYITVDEKGRVTSASTKTVTIPTSDNTDTKVTQNAVDSTVDKDYRIILSYDANDTAVTNIVNKYTNLRYNPSTNKLSTGNLQLAGTLTVSGQTTLNDNLNAQGVTATNLLVNGAANFVQSPTAPTPAKATNDTTIATTAFVKTVAGDYLPLAGGKMTGVLSWNDGNALPVATSSEYFLVIDAFANGGSTKYITKANALKSLVGSSAIGSSTQPVYWNGSAFSSISSYSGDAALTGTPTAPTAEAGTNSTQIATTAFVANSIASLSTAMHFIGKATVAIIDGSTTDPTISGYDFTADRKPGDVIIDTDNAYEYVWTYEGKWERLGPDGSYKITQSAVDTGAATTNKWVSRIQQNANGVVTATLSSLDTSGTWSGNATTATTASKLSNTSKIGDTNKPVYFTANGVPAAINYTIDKNVPSNAVFTDTTYTFVNGTDGSFSVTPSGGSAQTVSIGKPATAGTADAVAWSGITGKPSTTLATDTGTSSITLAHGGKYKLTAGGTSIIFTMPTDNNTTYTFTNGTNGFTVTPSGGTAQTVTVTPSVSKSDVGLGNVTNHQQVHEVAWDNTNKKVTRSKNGTAGDVVQFKAGTGISLSADSTSLTITNNTTDTLTGTPGAGKTITAFDQVNGAVTATFADISITKSQITDFPTTMAPASHTHGNITNDGKLGTASRAVVTDANKNITVADLSVSSATAETTTATTFVYSVTQDSQGKITVKTRPLPTYNNYSLPLAANGTRGGIQIGYSESGNNYAVKLSSEKAYVTVPLDTKAPLASPALTGTPTAPTADAGTNSTQIATTAFVANAVSQGFSANDAMVFKGTIGSTNGSVSSLPTNNYSAGWTYRVADAGTYAGDYCEVGDLIIAVTDGPTSGSTITNSHWAKIEHNIDGALYKTNSVTYSGNKVLMSSGTNGAVKEGTISNANVIKTITWSAGSAPTLGTAISADDITAWSDGTLPSLTISTIAADDITAWSAGSVTTATVADGVLTITTGTAASLSYTARSIGSASGWSAGTKPSLSYTARSIPNVTSAGTAPSLTTTTQSVITGIS